MKSSFFALAVLFLAASAQAEVRTLSKPTGMEQIIDVSDCTSPALGSLTGV